MTTRYDDWDYDRDDRDRERYGHRSDVAYGSSYGEGYRRAPESYGGRRDYGRESDYGRYGRAYEDYGYGREGDYGTRWYGREGYGGGEYDRGYGGEGYYGGFGRGETYELDRYDYGEPSERYSERYNYPEGYRSGEMYGSRYGRRDDYGRGGYGGGGEERGWWDRASDEVASWFGDEEAERRRRMDDERARFRGRGPRGYRRSDDRIREDVNDRLTDDPYLDASGIEVSVQSGEVTLSGTVEGRYDKRRAEDIAESVSGVQNVENRLRVSRGTTAGTTTTGTKAGTTGTTGTATGAGTTDTSASSTVSARSTAT